MDRIDHIFIQLVALGLGNEVPFDADLKGIDWQAVVARAGRCGLDAVAFDGLSALYQLRPDLTDALDTALGGLKFDWLSLSLQAEQDYDAYERTLGRLVTLYNEAGFPVMVLKGYGLSLNYPVPRHRPTGDIDIYLFGRWKEADRMLSHRTGIRIDTSKHHHSTFSFGGRLVENHFDLLNIYARPSNRRLEPLLKELAARAPAEWVIGGTGASTGAGASVSDGAGVSDGAARGHGDGAPAARILLPCADFNALFLLRHAAGHFASVDISLRHVLDWLLFVRAHGAEVDWPWLYGVLERENTARFANSLNAIGVRYLGFDPSLFPAVENDSELVDRILGEILHPAYTDKEDGTLWKSLRVKPARWWANRWKYRLVFADSLPAAFLHSLFAKFLKPGTFVH